ncbi:ABC transporter substrate-binding protein [Rhodococcus sp. NPDC055024]
MLTIFSNDGPLYLPQYVADELGFFERESVPVCFESTAEGYHVLESAESDGRGVPVVLGSLWFCLLTANEPDPWIPVALSNARCHHIVAGRSVRPDRDAIVEDSVIIVPAGAPTPLIALQYGLDRRGPGRERIRILPVASADAADELFRRGVGDFLLLPAHRSARSPGLTTVTTIDEMAGDIPWSVYAVRRSMLRRDGVREALTRFSRAVGQAQAWTASHSPAECAQLVSARFSSAGAVEVGVGALHRLAVWPESPALPAAALERWAQILRASGVVPRYTGVRDDHENSRSGGRNAGYSSDLRLT